MYTVLIKSNNELITTEYERIIQRSKLVDTLHFLTDPMYKGFDMSNFTVSLEYILPNREYHSEILELSDELYKNKLEYKLPFDTSLTKEAGDIEFQVTFVNIENDEDGSLIQRVRKTTPSKIKIIPVAAWSDLIVDDALSCIDQRLIKAEALIKANEEMNKELLKTKADDLILEGNELQLLAQGSRIGKPVNLDDYSENNGVKVVEF